MKDYLQHSSKGTSWKKQRHEYDKKINKRYYYGYESALKKLWKLKKKYGDSEYYRNAKSEYEANKNIKKINQHLSDLYSNTAEKTGSLEAKKKAIEFQRRANDIIPKETKRIKIYDITSDVINRGKTILHKLLKRR